MTEKKTKKAPRPKKTVKKKAAKKTQSSSFGHQLLKGVTGLIALVAVVGILAMGADYFFKPGSPLPDAPSEKTVGSPAKKIRPEATKTLPVPKPDSPKKRVARKPEKIFEVFDDEPIKPPEVRKPPPETSPGLPRVSIIIDDIGFDRRMAENLTALDEAITLSLLPRAPHSRAIAETFHGRGIEIMLHLPMEPVEYPQVDPGPGALLSSMSPDQLIAQLREDISSVPYISGVNNHMGSRLTAISATMYQIFSVLKQEDLFFIDSRTSRESLCRPSSRLFKVPFAQRDVFLDNIQDVAYIAKQLDELVKIAEKHGSAIGIGHPYEATYEALKKEIGKVKSRVVLVPASSLVYISG